MPYSDGTLTDEDHAVEAQRLLKPSHQYEGDHVDVAQTALLDAVRGVGHALLAIHAAMELRRAEGRGW